MTAGALFWLIIFAISATVFFVVAAIVAVKGLSDLRYLLGPLDDGNHDSSDHGSAGS